MPKALIVPTVALPPVIPFTFHVTALFVAFWTVATNSLVRLMRTEALAGVTVMVTAGAAVTATYVVLDAWPSAA